MEDLTNIALKRYFDTLSKLGYMNYEEVNKLLVLIFLEELLDSDCKSFITENEYRIISKVLYCLYGSTCLIPYPKQIVDTSISCTNKKI